MTRAWIRARAREADPGKSTSFLAALVAWESCLEVRDRPLLGLAWLDLGVSASVSEPGTVHSCRPASSCAGSDHLRAHRTQQRECKGVAQLRLSQADSCTGAPEGDPAARRLPRAGQLYSQVLLSADSRSTPHLITIYMSAAGRRQPPYMLVATDMYYRQPSPVPQERVAGRQHVPRPETSMSKRHNMCRVRSTWTQYGFTGKVAKTGVTARPGQWPGRRCLAMGIWVKPTRSGVNVSEIHAWCPQPIQQGSTQSQL